MVAACTVSVMKAAWARISGGTVFPLAEGQRDSCPLLLLAIATH